MARGYLRGHAGLLGLRVSCVGRVERAAEGDRIDFLVGDPDALGALMADFSAYLDGASPTPTDVARIHAHAGTGERDPRTGAVIARYRDVMRGKLDPCSTRSGLLTTAAGTRRSHALSAIHLRPDMLGRNT